MMSDAPCQNSIREPQRIKTLCENSDANIVVCVNARWLRCFSHFFFVDFPLKTTETEKTMECSAEQKKEQKKQKQIKEMNRKLYLGHLNAITIYRLI